jgi:hypothetical protein
MWYSDMAAFINKTYAAQVASVTQLNRNKFGGISTWHIAIIATWAETETLMEHSYAQIMALVQSEIGNSMHSGHPLKRSVPISCGPI